MATDYNAKFDQWPSEDQALYAKIFPGEVGSRLFSRLTAIIANAVVFGAKLAERVKEIVGVEIKQAINAELTPLVPKLAAIDQLEQRTTEIVNTAINRRMIEADTAVNEALNRQVDRMFASDNFIERLMNALSANPKALPSLIKWLESSPEGFAFMGKFIADYNSELVDRILAFTAILGDQSRGYEQEVIKIAKLHLDGGESVEPEHLRAYVIREWINLSLPTESLEVSKAAPTPETDDFSTPEAILAKLKSMIKSELWEEILPKLKPIANGFVRRTKGNTLSDLLSLVQEKLGDVFVEV